MAKEISETYHFSPSDYDIDGINRRNGHTFRSFVAECEYSFHDMHSTEYAWMLYANSRTMLLLAHSKGVKEGFVYGMDLTEGQQFEPVKDPYVNGEIEKSSEYINVYGIDSAFMTEHEPNGYPILAEEQGIYPLTLLIDDTMRDGTIRLAVPNDTDGEEEEPVIIDIPKFEYA